MYPNVKEHNELNGELFKRIFHHGLNTILSKDDNPLYRTTVVTNGVEYILGGGRQTSSYSPEAVNRLYVTAYLL